MQDPKHGMVEKFCVPRVASALEMSIPFSKLLEVIISYFLIDLLLDLRVVGESIDFV